MNDRIKRSLEAFIVGLLRPIDFYASYACKVTSQNGDGTLELRPEDTRLGDFSKVPVHYGIPQTTATFQSGARVVLAFENGDRALPYIYAFDTSTLTVLTVGGAGAQFVALENLVKAELNKLRDAMNAGFDAQAAVNIALKAHVHTATPTTGISPGLQALVDPVDCGTISDVKAEKVKVK